MNAEASRVSLEVYDPTGTTRVTGTPAPRLSSLSGKTICELSDFAPESSRTFAAIREQLQKRFPNARIIPHTEFPRTYGIQPEFLTRLLKEKSCDGAIVGNAT